MVKDFKGQVKVADVQAAFDEIVGKVNSLVSSYNFQGSVEDIDYTIGGANLAPSGYTLSVGGMKQFLKACEGCVVGGKPFKLDDNHIKMSTGLVVSLAGIQKLPDTVLEVKGTTLWWDSYNKQYAWTGTVPRNEYFYFAQEDDTWYTYLKKGTYTVTYRNQETGEYEPKQIVLNEDLRFPSTTEDIYANIITPESSGEVPITVLRNGAIQDSNTDVVMGSLTRANSMNYAGNNFSSIVRTARSIIITPQDIPEGLTDEELSYTFRVPYKQLANWAVTGQYLHFNIKVTRTNNDESEEVLAIQECRYNVPDEIHEAIATFRNTIKLDKPLEYGETIEISISDIDSDFRGQASVPSRFYGIWGYESGSNETSMDVYIHSNKNVSFSKKINLIVEPFGTEFMYLLDSVEGWYDNYSDLGYFTWDTNVYTDRPVSWEYVNDTSTMPDSEEISEGMYRICDINMNSSSKFVGTAVNIAAENINGKFNIISQDRDYTTSRNYIRVQRNGKTNCYNALDTSKDAKFVSALTADVSSDNSGGNDVYLFGTHVAHVGYQGSGRGEYYFPMTYLFIPKGVENPYTYYDSWRDTTNPNASCQKVLNVKIDKEIKTENK